MTISRFTRSGIELPAAGKILQIVRATDTTLRTTTSASFVDASLSVTITPQKNTSAVILISTFIANVSRSSTTTTSAQVQITDDSNNAISGAQNNDFRSEGPSGNRQLIAPLTLVAYATPATLSATTFKLRFKTDGTSSLQLINQTVTAQFYAIEVAA